LESNFRETFLWAKDKNIFLYGIGQRTSSILKEVEDFNIVGLIDKNVENFGKIINNKKVTDISEVEKYNDVIVIIVASQVYWQVISNRILQSGKVKEDVLYYYTGEKVVISDKKIVNPFIDIKLSELLLKIENSDIISFDLFDTLIMRKKFFPLSNSRIEEEINLSVLRHDMIKAFNYAQKLGKKVLITTDMYLSNDEIESLLKKNDICNYTELIVSSDINKTKVDGTIYEYIRNKYCGKILHVGDNYEIDIINAKKFDIETYFIPSASEIFSKSSLSSLCKYADNLDNEAVLGLFNANLFNSPFKLNNLDNTVNVESLEQFGYCFLGPLFFNYIKELVNSVKSLKVKDVLFLSRDGYLLKKLYEFYISEFNIKNIANPIYLKISSRLIELCAIYSEKDIYELIDNRMFDGSFAKFCNVVFDIEISENDPNFYNEIVLPTNNEELKLWIKPYVNTIIEKAGVNRDNYLKYLNSLEFNENTVISDIGYHGSQQYYLEKILSRKFNGYYFIFDSLSKFNNSNMSGLYDFNSSFSNLFKVLEAVCVSDEGSFVKVLSNGEFVSDKKYKNQEYFNEKCKIVDGIKMYFLDMKKLIGNSEKIGNTKLLAQKIFESIFDGSINISKDINNILFFDTPYSSANETKVI